MSNEYVQGEYTEQDLRKETANYLESIAESLHGIAVDVEFAKEDLATTCKAVREMTETVLQVFKGGLLANIMTGFQAAMPTEESAAPLDILCKCTHPFGAHVVDGGPCGNPECVCSAFTELTARMP